MALLPMLIDQYVEKIPGTDEKPIKALLKVITANTTDVSWPNTIPMSLTMSLLGVVKQRKATEKIQQIISRISKFLV